MSVYMGFIGIACLILVLWLILKRSSISYPALKIHRQPVPFDQMEEHVIKLAGEHFVSSKKSIASWPLPRMDDNYHFILSVYTQLNDTIQEKHDVSSAAEWILDNFYLIEEQVKQLRCELAKKNYSRLPVLKSGSFKGHARIFALVMELSLFSDGQINEVSLADCLNAYQKHNKIYDREIWALPSVIKLVLLENIRNICEKIRDTQTQWNKADDMAGKILAGDEADEESITRLLQSIMKEEKINLSFIEHLSYRLRALGPRYTAVSKHINEYLDAQEKGAGAAAQQELQSQSSLTVSAGNAITCLKYFATFDWSDLFEAVSFVGQILCKDPDGTYPLMDLATRNIYRSKIEELSYICGIEETVIASKAIALAEACKARGEAAGRTWHVGYYLIDKGVGDLLKALKANTIRISATTKLARNHPQVLYIGSIVLITVLLTGIAARYAMDRALSYEWAWALAAIIAVLLPSSEIAVSIVNWVAAKTLKAAIFPALELKDGIPESMSAMIVIPTLLPDQAKVKEILDNMEIHYLSNREENLYFALVGAFRDSDTEVPADLSVINAAMGGVRALNEKYGKDGAEIFFYFHRASQYSPENKKWIGWERKRGALMEFNDLLLGCEDTSFFYRSNSVKDFSKIKYVITLDSDTILPIGMAKKMIAAMAHPLNRPVIDPAKGIVVDGYGLMQPRVDFDSETSGRSPFSKIYTGQAGIDPYSSAISDVYQDMFGEGIYTGKGIYDLQVFQQILKNAIPADKVLSHDLYEGSYVRAALVTNLKLVDSYPTKYNSLSARLYRWVRGDWQLLPFLFPSIPNGSGMIKNPLSLLSKWKIFDNLRRSLVSPALMVLIALSLSILPGNLLLWLGYALVALLFPLISSAMGYILSGGLFREKIKSYIPIIIGLKALLYQAALTFLFLPYQAYSMLKAASLTLWRVYISRENMLEWITSADSDANQKESLSGYYGKMHASVWEALILALLVIRFHPPLTIAGVLLFAVWSVSPYIAYHISKDYGKAGRQVSEEEMHELRRTARYTWRYFEEFADIKNNYLAPDNFQQEPYRGIAARTSPTNIGLGLLSVLTARDMGYIGILEMADQISKTISSIESLQKWNGHLYNWYDTKTLEPLNPRYVSTVDSGNLVCYLTTLVQGLKSYLDHPIADQKCVDGILDTLGCAEREGFKAAEMTGYLNETVRQPFDLAAWGAMLKRLSREGCFDELKASPWRNKIERMIELKRAELLELAPWADMLAAMPQAFTEKLSVEQSATLQEITGRLNVIPTLRDIPAVCKSALDFFGTLTVHDDGTAVWLHETGNAFVQSGNAAEAFIRKYGDLMERIKALSEATRFLPLYNAKKQLFSIGYSIKENKLSRSHYDLLASEARQTSFIAIARGEIPAVHWFKMGRTLTVMDGYKGLVSWTGTIFEYLMPLLIMKSYQNTLLDESYAFAVRSQKKYGMQQGIPWGTSESGYYSMDSNLDYKYKAIGVPWLGLKRGLAGDSVAAPYATFLALMVDPEGALKNLARLKADGMEGAYGFFEAADYTQKRLTNRKIAIVKSYMAHHQGMSLLAIDNYLNHNIMQERFHADSEVQSARLLLQEKIPENVVFTKEEKEKILPVKGAEGKENNLVLKYSKPDETLPKVHILTNGDYSVVLTDRGTGFSKNKEIAVTRWREDSTLDQYGMFYFLRHVETGAVWSCAYAPLNTLPEKYEVTFTPDKAQFQRVDGNIETTTEIVVASGDSVEIRRISLKNLGEKTATLELTGYFEVVLATQAQDIGHPAFSNLFVKTEYLPEKGCILASRRPRSHQEETWCAANRIVLQEGAPASVQFETDRMKFIGRGRSIASPVGMECDPLSGTVGPVLDPVMSLRARVIIEPGRTVSVSFVTAAGNTGEALLNLLEKYATPDAIKTAFRLARVKSQLEAKYLDIPKNAMALYEDMISHLLYISPLKRQYQDVSIKNTKGQSALWAYGISGDLPVVLAVVEHTENTAFALDVMKAHEYWWLKGLKVDLVILANMESGYRQPFQDFISDIESGQTRGKGKAYILNVNEISDTDLLYAVARIVLKDDGRTLKEQMAGKREQPQFKSRRFAGKAKEYPGAAGIRESALLFFNGLGGFQHGGPEYVIHLKDGENTPAPWVNVVANPGFGFLVSESGSSYTWCGNSRENKLTPWSNDAVCDSPGEALYIGDNDTGETWTVTALPVREPGGYTIRHGFGYSAFAHDSHGIHQNLVQFVPVQDPVKVSLLNLVNGSAQKRSLSLTYYVRPVLGVSDQVTAMHVNTSLGKSGALLIKNPYNEEFSGQTGFVDSSVAERQVTGDRKEFFGSGGIASPDALKHEKLSGTLGTGLDPCAVMQVNVALMPNESIDVVFLLGMCGQASGVEALAKKYTAVPEAKRALDEVKRFWQEKLSVIRVDTPSDSFDLMLNGWLQYQVISCRLWARSSFYQSGGAFGFRDQLQDCLSIVHMWPEAVRSQILLHAKHQFTEGDVQHWWHEPWGRGTRTRCSDDLLWLPYVTAEYLKATGDETILKVQLPFLEDEVLKDGEQERYARPRVSAQTATLFDHCILAIGKALKFGSHGLPLIGSGDWNDGMNSVGKKGMGESVWLGWFAVCVLKSFAPVCRMMGETSKAEEYMRMSEVIAQSVEENAWDGEWYQRAYFDDGKILGSKSSEECSIDSIAQSWAVISGASDMKRASMAMDSLEKRLADRENGIIRLLAPPFDDGELEPGYIKGYLPGVRENGGQYTHAAAWAIMAWAKLGDGDRAWGYFDLINPVNHTKNTREYSTYRLEPYVMAADVYSLSSNAGRGGWSWYTGSAGWMYKAGLEELLGFRKNGNILTFDPCIPRLWREYAIEYRYFATQYKIRIYNPEGISKGVSKVLVDGNTVEGNVIRLADDGVSHDVKVIMGA